MSTSNPLRSVHAAALLMLGAACGGSSRPAPPANTFALVAVPAAARPGETVRLVPTFARGTGRIEPGVGDVVSGGSYEVGPFDGARRFTLTVDDQGTSRTAVVDVPLRYRERIGALPAPANARTRHGAAMLADGSVLLVGGASPTPVFWANAERFDPLANAFAPVGDLSVGRSESTVVALPDGGALSFGGPINASSFDAATRIESWSPLQLGWSIVGNMLCNRSRHTATRLADGRVLLAGGAAVGPFADRDAEIFEPGVGARAPAGQAMFQRAAHTATELPDGRVLLAGGYDVATGLGIALAEIFDPVAETFMPSGSLLETRFYHAAVRLDDGRVLMVGGDGENALLASAELFDPVTSAFEPAGVLGLPATEVRAVRLGSGEVLVAGGLLAQGVASDRLEVWDPTTKTFRLLPARLPAAVTGHSLHLLRDGRVAIFGGDPGNGFPVATAAVFD